MSVEILIALFPAVFMIHEFEEMIWLLGWAKKNLNKMPQNEKLTNTIKLMNNKRFIFIIFIEYLILLFICIITIKYAVYNFMVALLIAYIIHSVIHIFQTIIVKSYVPALGTAIITSFYAVYLIFSITMENDVNIFKIVLLSFTLIIFIYLFLISMYKIVLQIFKD